MSIVHAVFVVSRLLLFVLLIYFSRSQLCVLRIHLLEMTVFRVIVVLHVGTFDKRYGLGEYKAHWF